MSRVWLRPNLDHRALLRVQRMSATFTPALMEGSDMTTNLTPARVTTLTRDSTGGVNGYYVTDEATGAHVGDDYARDLTEALTGAVHHDTDRN